MKYLPLILFILFLIRELDIYARQLSRNENIDKTCTPNMIGMIIAFAGIFVSLYLILFIIP